MKRVLIITYYWPPSGGAGVQRWLKFVKYLRNEGWEPVIYTPENPEYPASDNSLSADIPTGIEIIRTPIWEPYSFYKKLVGAGKNERINAGFLSEKKRPGLAEKFSIWLRGNFFIPDARKFWIRPSVKFLTEYLSKHKVDAIVSTGPPHSMHMIALGVKKRTGLPWLADFRDPWTNIDFYHELMLSRWADRKHHRMEMSILRNADEVVVISNSMKSDFIRLLKREYTVITNGYDDTDMSTEKIAVDAKFSVAHIGTMVKTRNPDILWEALKAEVSENPGFAANLEIKLVGSVDYSVLERIDQAGLTKFVNRIPYLPHNEVVKIQQQSQVLLLLINDTPNARVILPGKFFEYMASGRPILCIGPFDGDAAQVIRETGTGYVVEKDDLIQMRATLQLLFSKFRSGDTAQHGSDIGRFSRARLTAQLAERLDRISL